MRDKRKIPILLPMVAILALSGVSISMNPLIETILITSFLCVIFLHKLREESKKEDGGLVYLVDV